MKTLSTRLSINEDLIQSPNLCDRFSEEDLFTIGNWTHEGDPRDLTSASHGSAG